MNRYIYNDQFDREAETFIVHTQEMSYIIKKNHDELTDKFIDGFMKVYSHKGKYKFGQHKLAKVEWVEKMVIGDTVHGEMLFFAYKPRVAA